MGVRLNNKYYKFIVQLGPKPSQSPVFKDWTKDEH